MPAKVEATALNLEYGDISDNYEIGPVAYEIAEDRTVTILEPEKNSTHAMVLSLTNWSLIKSAYTGTEITIFRSMNM